MKPELKVALEQAESLKKELLSAERMAEKASADTYGKPVYPFLYGHAVQSCKSAVVRVNTIIELINSL
jgi:hypothetical protein